MNKRIAGNLIILGLMVGILAIDHWVFQRVFHVSHWRWYVAHGVEIGFVTAAVALVWDEVLESNLALISAEPAIYCAANLHLMGVCIETIGVQFQSAPGHGRTLPLHEVLLGIPLTIVLVGALVLWLLVVAPAQYFVFLICGSPARVLARSPYRLVVWFENSRIRTQKILRAQPIPEGRMAASFAHKPVAVTNIFVSLVLLVLQRVVGA